MGLFKKLKSAMGIGYGELELELGPRPHLGESQTGVVRFSATKNVNVYEIGVRLIHRFYAEGQLEEMVLDSYALVEQAAFAESEMMERPFELNLPWEAVPSAPGFSWFVEASVLAEGHDALTKKCEAMVDMSVVAGAVDHVLKSQFGFSPKGWAATEDGLMINYAPDQSVRQQFRSLTVIFDENEDSLNLGVNLQDFSPSALARYRDRYDTAANFVWLSLLRSEFDRSEPDYQAVYAELQPLFTFE